MNMEKKIFIIEDNEQDRKIITRFLNEAGFNDITVAEEGERGVEKAKSEKPDLAIVDTVLPGIDGYEICRRLKAVKDHVAPKVIIMTGTIDAVDAVEARKAGADDYCAKTADFSTLIEAVKKLI